MTPESLVATRETCMWLKEKGFTQDTHFCWAEPYRYQTDRTAVVYPRFLGGQHAGSPPREYCAAPTLAEVLEQLRKGWNRADVETWNSEMGPYCCVSVDDLARTVEVRGSNPAEAAALLWEKVNL